MKIYDLQSIPSELLPQVGGKARGLNQLLGMGFAVPDGFIIMDIDSEADYEQAYEYYESKNLGEVAVRSSATIEDGVNYSNAGQYETFLNVSGKQKFMQAVRDCISSLGNFRSQKYSKMFLGASENKMTVVVQQMVKAAYAGVLFTVDPMDSESVLIECVEGLGESLVSGEVAAQQYRVKGDEVTAPENGHLSVQKVAELAAAAAKAEEQFGQPMDLEWAINGEDKLLFLQARPITVVEDDGVTLNEFDFPHDVTGKTITTCNVREMLPTAVTPLSMSTSVYCLDHGMRRMMEKNHAIKHIDDLPPFSCITPFYNNMFFNMSTNYINAYRIAGTCKETSDIVICGRVLEEFPDNFADYSSNLVRVKNMIYFLPYILSCKKATEGIDEVVRELHFDYGDTLEGLYQQTKDNFHLLEKSFFYHYCSSYFSGAASMLARRGIAKFYDDDYKIDALISGVLTNIDGIESAMIIDMMRELAGLIIADRADAKDMTKEQLADYLTNASGAVKESYEKFMRVNGHRGISETEMRVKCWADDIVGFSESLLGVIASYERNEKKKSKDWTEYLDELLAGVKKSKHKSIKGLITKARLGAWSREYTKSRCILAVSLFRRAYRLIAQKLVALSLLPDEDLIYFITKDEIGQLMAGDKTLVKKAMKRRRLYPAQCAMRFEEVYSGKPVPIENTDIDENATAFRGLPASPGVATGKARIIRSVEDANKLVEGEIMVAACTDVGWTPYYCLAAGLITEIGSCLSHGVVVAREYGLPTVVNVHGVMSAIHDGDIITMDGSTGNITIRRDEEND